MITTNTALFSRLFDVDVQLQTKTDTYTDNFGNRVVGQQQLVNNTIFDTALFDAMTFDLQPPSVIKASLQDISAENIDQQLSAAYQTGDIYMFTTAAVKIGDLVITSGSTWQIVEVVSESRHICPGRNQYLIRRIVN